MVSPAKEPVEGARSRIDRASEGRPASSHPLAVPMPPTTWGNRIEGRWLERPAENVADAIVTAAEACGVERWWFVSGTEIAFLQEAITKAEALGRSAPRLITQLHEQVALAAAIGDAAVSGHASAVAGHVDVGLLHMGSAIHSAWRGEAPVLILTGYPGTSYPGLLPGGRDQATFWQQQQWDQGAIVRQYVKWDHKLAPYDNPGAVISRALQIAQTAPRGPVYLAVPGEVAFLPLEGKLRFPGPELLGPPVPPAPDSDALTEAARWLAGAKHPVIISGRSGHNPASVGPLVELAECVGARVISGNNRMNFPDSSPHRSRDTSLREADVILTVDCAVPWVPGPAGPSAEARIVAIDVDPTYGRIPLYEFPADVRITADATRALTALVAELGQTMTREQRTAAQQRSQALAVQHDAAREASVQRARASAESGQITYSYLSYELGQILDEDSILVGSFVSESETGLFRRERPGTMFIGSGGAALGTAPGMALGVKMARPQSTVVYAGGDGDYMFGVSQAVLWGARNYPAPFLAVIYNNRGYGTGTSSLARRYPDGYSVKNGNFQGGWFDPPPNFAGEAAANGCLGERVHEPAALGPTLRRALDAVQRQGVPAVVDVWLPKLMTGDVVLPAESS
jgi:acetolactate synthase I/II/III large subunit